MIWIQQHWQAQHQAVLKYPWAEVFQRCCQWELHHSNQDHIADVAQIADYFDNIQIVIANSELDFLLHPGSDGLPLAADVPAIQKKHHHKIQLKRILDFSFYLFLSYCLTKIVFILYLPNKYSNYFPHQFTTPYKMYSYQVFNLK